MTSIRWAALCWIAAVLLAVGIVSSGIAYLAGKMETDCFLDSQLMQVAQQAGEGPASASTLFRRIDPEDELVVQIWDSSGEITKSTGGVALPRQPRDGFTDLIFEGVPWRVFTATDSKRTVQIGQREEVRDEIAEHLAMSAALPIFVAIPLAWALVAWSLSRLLKRLDRLSAEMARRSVGAAESLPTSEAPLEVRPLVVAMNELLIRQRNAIDRQRRFVSDAAHELRTPLTAVQLLVDTLRERGERRRGDDAVLLGELTVAIRRSRSLSDQLLKLARADTDYDDNASSDLDLRELLLVVAASQVSQASKKQVELSLHAATSIRVDCSEIDLTNLLSNLVDNAIRYTPSGGSVTVSLTSVSGTACVEVVDTGIGIPPEALPRIYDRFYRAAGQDFEGSGLGLSIAKAVSDKYGFDLSIANHAAGGVIARVIFPRSRRIDEVAAEPSAAAHRATG